jgi:hypothetical protein
MIAGRHRGKPLPISRLKAGLCEADRIAGWVRILGMPRWTKFSGPLTIYMRNPLGSGLLSPEDLQIHKANGDGIEAMKLCSLRGQ